MPYSNGTLVSDWHKARQAEPKDYDLAAVPEGKKSLHKSTYRHFGTSGNICWSTTTGEHLSQCLMKKQYEDVVTRRSMLHADLFHAFVSNRETHIRKAGHNAVLPRHHPEHNLIDLKTTYVQAYPPTDTHDKQETKVTHDQPEVSSKFRKQISQFTDAADYRRLGRNTWQDDRDNRRTAMFKPTNPMGL
ncbi:cilia- and flagella-associated protein 95-like isoform X1 [Conger conger]|uniref:cilia- and flagella-associated protein 95-like isoform X1 n=1 Tax=Conger conger TaxID=82655 RepID=UPI002A5AF083|nr:cilia- and flagella-associated protein 95-like isoform X1 [Conger conger]XP_061115594.1 cilia- and flagella-associated protein 95-like isoform X1 [Conger conger]XP_061115595.1 cilia- and flagella-associated protein 95-like isoform X1 [Conger conger]